MDKIAIIGSGVIAKVIADRAHELNIETHCFSFNKKDVAISSVDVFHEVDVFDIDTITRICEEVGVAGVIATTELTILPAAKISKNLQLNGNDISVADEITNKYLTRNKVKNIENLFQPKYWRYVSGDVPKVDCYPVIVKPIAAGGKRGVCVVYSEADLPNAIEEAISFSKVEGALIEEYLAGGSEYSIESLSYKGKHNVIQVTQKDSSGPPHCNELGHHQPAAISEEMRGKIDVIIENMLSAVRIMNGPCHTEIKIIDEKIYLIEINGRPGGDHIAYPLTELSTGYPFMSGIIWVAIDKFDGHEPSSLEKHYSGIFFVTEETAQLKAIFDRCENYPWLYHKNKVGDKLPKMIYNDEDNHNYFIYYSKDQKPDFDEYIG